MERRIIRINLIGPEIAHNSANDQAVNNKTKMLPDYEYKHYYDQKCEECEDAMVGQDEIYEDGGQCGECQKVMCEDCREDSSCYVCTKKMEEDEDGWKDIAVCGACTRTCDSCPNLTFHRSCLAEHKRTCNKMARAKRALSEAEEKVEEKEHELKRMKRRCDELQKEIRAAKKSKLEAKEKVQTLERRRRRRA